MNVLVLDAVSSSVLSDSFLEGELRHYLHDLLSLHSLQVSYQFTSCVQCMNFIWIYAFHLCYRKSLICSSHGRILPIRMHVPPSWPKISRNSLWVVCPGWPKISYPVISRQYCSLVNYNQTIWDYLLIFPLSLPGGPWRYASGKAISLETH